MLLKIAAVYVGASVLTFIAYWMDKRAAQRKRLRIPEATLLVLGLAGGWPGGWVAQQTLRHKTKKSGYRALFWISVIVNIACVAWLIENIEV